LKADEATFQTIWFVVSLLTELVVVLILRTEKFSLFSRPSRLLLWTTISVAAIALTIPFLAPVAGAFGFVGLSPSQIWLCLSIVGGYVLATEAAKTWFYRKGKRIGRGAQSHPVI
jgi:Mg2+-importing ATPase